MRIFKVQESGKVEIFINAVGAEIFQLLMKHLCCFGQLDRR